MPSNSSISAEAAGAFTRCIDLVGEAGFRRLRAARVAVLGLGGVGSHAAVALARAGVGHVRLVDHDKVTASGLNRHAVARLEDVGRPKVRVVGRQLQAIAPEMEVREHAIFFHEETAHELLGDGLDMVVDAIDSFTPKVVLLATCVGRGLPVVSSMGASARVDPTLLRVDDLSRTRVCPLARAVRKALGKRDIRAGVTCVFSIEAPLPPLPPDEGDEVLRRGRVRNRLPSLSVMPGIFGYAVAGQVIQLLAGVEPGKAR